MALSWTAARRELSRRLSEPAPGRVQLLTGPRQAGKTTLLELVAEPFGDAVVHARGDFRLRRAVPPLPDAWRLAEQAAAARRRALLAVDDVHLVRGWEAWLAGAWARARAGGLPLHVLLTGSCALEGGSGSPAREWLEQVPLARWTARALVEHFAIDVVSAIDHLVARGARPPVAGPVGALHDAHPELAIVTPTLEQDLPSVVVLRKPALLRGLFDACATSATRVVSLGQLRAACGTRAPLETVAQYLRLLEAGGLVAALPELGRGRWSPRDARFRIVILDNALLARDRGGSEAGPVQHRQAVVPDGVPFSLRVRNACLAHAWSAGGTLRFWREGRLEVDAVVEDEGRRQLLVVRPGPVGEAAVEGMTELCGRLPSYQPVLIGDAEGRAAAEAADIDWVDWREFLAGDADATLSALVGAF